MAKPPRDKKPSSLPAGTAPSEGAVTPPPTPAPAKRKPANDLSKAVEPAPTQAVKPETLPAVNAPAAAPKKKAVKSKAAPIAPAAPVKSPEKVEAKPEAKPAAPPAAKVRKSPPRVKKTAPTAPSPTPAASASAGKRLLFITSECTPYAQSGGLGDAVAGMTKALRKIGHDVRIVMPLYGFIDRGRYGITYSRSCCVHFGQGEEIWVGIHEGKLDGEVPMWFIDYDRFFGRGSIYGDSDDAYRFGVLSKAALQVCKDTGFIPHIAHVHDWMSSMAAVFLKTWDRVLSPLSSTASVLTIHNIGYQGKFDPSVLSFYGLGGDYMTPDRLEDFGMVNLLKAGIQYADAVTTVSPTYAREIREPVGGMGLAPYLNNRAEHVFGILNGVDTTLWNPSTDKYLPSRYSADDLLGKAACKQALQERFGLKVDPKIPIFGVVSRFAPQKGFDLMRGALPQALRDMVMQVVVLGSGDPFVENFFRWLSGANPGRANAHIGFSPEIAHLVEAGSDFFLMPSLYEPCGLNQMYSSHYGTLPVVRATGGLDDTVENYNEATGEGTGFKFWEISGRALFYTIGWAVSTWFDRPHHYQAMQQAGMKRDFSWDASARQYEKVYEHALAHRAAL
jgi:starch synthase